MVCFFVGVFSAIFFAGAFYLRPFLKLFLCALSRDSFPVNVSAREFFMSPFTGAFSIPFSGGVLLHALSQGFYFGLPRGDILRDFSHMDDFHSFFAGPFPSVFLQWLFASTPSQRPFPCFISQWLLLRCRSRGFVSMHCFTGLISVRSLAGGFAVCSFSGVSSVHFFIAPFSVLSLPVAFAVYSSAEVFGALFCSRFSPAFVCLF